jgi:predicted HTH domain antitoxin
MSLVERLPKVLIPRYYKTRTALEEDAFRALLNFKPELKIEVAIELYVIEEISLSRAAEIAGVDVENFKGMLRARGLKISSYVGSNEEIERGLELI